MKSITFHLDNGKTVYARDDSDDNLEEYTNELSKILIEPNVVTISTTECELIIRPSRIDVIEVSETKEIEESDVDILKSVDVVEEEILKSATIQNENKSEESINEDDEEDIITDGD